MIACDCGGGKVVKFAGPAEKIVEWLAGGGGAVFAVKGLAGSITFNFNNDRDQLTPVVHGVAAAPPGLVS